MSAAVAKKIVKAYGRLLRARRITYTQLFLFGSYARGRAYPWSDIDVCVVSKQFSGKRWDAGERALWRLRSEVDMRIEPVAMSPEEFKSASPLAHEVRTTGIRIA